MQNGELMQGRPWSTLKKLFLELKKYLQYGRMWKKRLTIKLPRYILLDKCNIII